MYTLENVDNDATDTLGVIASEPPPNDSGLVYKVRLNNEQLAALMRGDVLTFDVAEYCVFLAVKD